MKKINKIMKKINRMKKGKLKKILQEFVFKTEKKE